MRITKSIGSFFMKTKSAEPLKDRICHVRQLLDEADGVLIGAGAGLSTAAGLRFDGEDFNKEFEPWINRYGFKDLYSAAFYPFKTREEYWGFWARHIWFARYRQDGLPLYHELCELVKDKDYFVLTTNVDGQFAKSGFDTDRLFACQGDYGMFQTKSGRLKKLYPNEKIIRTMMVATTNCRIPTELIPYSPDNGEMLVPNLRSDDLFVEDAHWHRQAKRYQQFVEKHRDGKLLLLELGVGFNTPTIIRFPFEHMAAEFPHTALVRFNQQALALVDGIKDFTVLDSCEELTKLKHYNVSATIC